MGEAGEQAEPLSERIAALQKAVKKASTPILRARKALDDLAAAGPELRLVLVESALKPVRDADLGGLDPEIEAARVGIVGELTELHRQLEARARSEILGGLTRAAQQQDLEVVQLTERPLVVVIAPLSVELDLTAGVARLMYAREVVDEVELAPARILKGRSEALRRVRAESVESAEFFELARRAYDVVRQGRGIAAGERVDLVDLLGPLSLLRAPVGDWRSLRAKQLTPYPRYLLAYQLRRLRRDGITEQGGLRLELGTATGGSARDKRGVLFVPTTPTEGQYHLSICFTPP